MPLDPEAPQSVPSPHAFADQLLRIKRPPADPPLAGEEIRPLLVDAPGDWPDGAQVRVQVHKRGSGPNALLVHGWQGRPSDMERISDALVAAGFTVWVPDLPGHGLSEGERLSIPLAARVLRATQAVAGPFALAVAHSIGGACVVHAMEEGLQVDRIALLATPTHYGFFARAMSRHVGLDDEATGQVIERLEQLIGVHPDWIDMPRQAPARTEPVLLIHSADDKVVSFKGAQKVATLWPGAQWLLLDGLGHYKPLLEDPQVLAQVMDFALAAGAPADARPTSPTASLGAPA